MMWRRLFNLFRRGPLMCPKCGDATYRDTELWQVGTAGLGGVYDAHKFTRCYECDWRMV